MTKSPERWRRLQVLFESASSLPRPDVEDFLDRECAEDAGLREELRSLLNLPPEAVDPLAVAVRAAAREVVGAEVSRPAEVGETIGKYRIVEKLGVGGMGIVYAAEDTELRRKVALKLLARTDVQNAGRLRRLRREARALARLSHPNIVTIHSVEHADDRYFLTMELVAGRPLADLISAGGLAPDRFFGIALPLSRGLAAAHEQGVTHRDLKPANVMVGDGDVVKILDFGLAKLRRGEAEGGETPGPSATLTPPTGIVMGTMPYMSPEQVEGRPLDPRSDIFSIGVMLYELAAGSRPFEAESSAALSSAILTQEPASLAGLRPDLPPRLDRIIRRCLEKDPEKRYQHAESLSRDLARLQAATRLHPSLSRGLGRVLALMPAIRRRRIAVAASLVSMVILAAALLHLDATRRAAAGAVTAASDEALGIDAIAVLPLRNDSADEGQEYLADGMTEILITELSRRGLKVISRTSVMRFKDTEQPMAEIADQLGVDAVVEGSVLRSGDEVRVSARLVHASSDVPIWHQSYERNLRDVLILQSEVARSIAEEIRGTLWSQQRNRRAVRGRVSPRAAEAYFKGLSASRWEQAGYFRQAIEEESDFALAHAALAGNLVAKGWVGWPFPPEEAFGGARRSALEALMIDRELSAAHAVLGWVAFSFDWEWPASEKRFRRAIEIDPGNGWARSGLALLLAATGRFEEALAEAERARELDPLSVWPNVDLCRILYYARRYDEALRRLYRRFDPVSADLHRVRWQLLEATGEREAAISARLIFEKLDGTPAPVIETWDEALQTSGRTGFWREFIRVHLTTPEKLVWAVHLAEAHTLLEERDQALTWLETAYDRRRPRTVFLGVDPIWDPLRSDPRFNDLLRRMNLPRPERPEAGMNRDLQAGKTSAVLDRRDDSDTLLPAAVHRLGLERRGHLDRVDVVDQPGDDGHGRGIASQVVADDPVPARHGRGSVRRPMMNVVAGGPQNIGDVLDGDPVLPQPRQVRRRGPERSGGGHVPRAVRSVARSAQVLVELRAAALKQRPDLVLVQRRLCDFGHGHLFLGRCSERRRGDQHRDAAGQEDLRCASHDSSFQVTGQVRLSCPSI